MTTFEVSLVAEHELPLLRDLVRRCAIGLDVEREFANSHATLLVARDITSRDLIGFALSWRVADELELIDVAVSPERRRRGVGRALLEEVCERGRTEGLRAVFLEVRRSNTSAQNLYRSLGFYALGVRPNYYSEPNEDALLLSLELEARQ